jgi:hypothetical protein
VLKKYMQLSRLTSFFIINYMRPVLELSFGPESPRNSSWIASEIHAAGVGVLYRQRAADVFIKEPDKSSWNEISLHRSTGGGTSDALGNRLGRMRVCKTILQSHQGY